MNVLRQALEPGDLVLEYVGEVILEHLHTHADECRQGDRHTEMSVDTDGQRRTTTHLNAIHCQHRSIHSSSHLMCSRQVIGPKVKEERLKEVQLYAYNPIYIVEESMRFNCWHQHPCQASKATSGFASSAPQGHVRT